ncbi:helicase-related protein [Telmatospirillum siberiense]|uniref:Disulfide oxidoreductase n=1 Tax=Telmatospirillum siberiense TaxID=382514 RepID=A0A2N3PVD9_9PROT|nr:helicase-related protein [Telmatospirillum siberiense]PKU24360.1 disulfide oxidoreductase [Telmatospirillum siberiense]
MTSLSASGRVIAVLGPTNTGKTHLALERMLGHRSGMIGFPLRLLARENYDRIARIKGKGAVALLTGEEKIVPAHPQWFVCTVESMPLDRRVDFLAIDEIQLCADPDRGHVFTDRLLHARGASETMFLGAETIKPLIRRLVPGTEFVTRPRFSQLSYSGEQKLQRLAPRSAIVAFSATDVYTLAELMRRQKGGAAVVLGALSPRTRNAQVGLYQAGEVDYLVATDAIGMGLNMDVDHVAFAGLRKFDGRVPRHLEATEVAQIAGRAGRHMNDGTFGTTGDIGPIPGEIVDAVENHTFPPLQRLQWRNSDLRLTSIEALLASLNRQPDRPGLIRARDADDQLVLQALAADAEIAARARSPERVRLLWEVCQVPDFRKTLAEQHSRLLGVIFRHLSGPEETLPTDWLDQQISRLDRTDGEIDTLLTRIANIRTWTYISHRGDWLKDAAAWQERSRAIEDRLSDALHERLTQRFVDRRTTMLVRRMKDADTLASDVGTDGEVRVEGHFVGKLRGFRFEADHAEGMHATRTVAAAATRALRPEIAGRVALLAAEPDEAFRLDGQGFVLWRDNAVARLAAGGAVLRPAVTLLPSELIETAARDRLNRRLGDWLDAFLGQALAPLFAVLEAPLSGPGRGLAFQLGEGLGSLPRRAAEAQIRPLTADDRKALAALDVRLGVESVFLPRLLKPASQSLRGLLWCVHRSLAPLAPPPPGSISVPLAPGTPPAFLEAIGLRPLGGRAVRLDMLERFAAQARQLARQGAFPVGPALSSRLNLSPGDTGAILEALGYRAEATAEGGPLFRAPSRRTEAHRRPRSADKREASPFAALLQITRA